NPHSHSFPTRRSSDLAQFQTASMAERIPPQTVVAALCSASQAAVMTAVTPCHTAPAVSEAQFHTADTASWMALQVACAAAPSPRSEEHTSELQSRENL